MHPADMHALQVLERLQTHFGIPALGGGAGIRLPAGILAGLEVEVPWRAYFPDLWEKHFFGGTRPYAAMSPDEQALLTADCNALEAELLPRLEATQRCGIPRGKDRYWEFALPPVNDLALAGALLNSLSAAHLLPWGNHSLQITLCGVGNNQELYTVLLVLELLFVRKERIAQSCNGYGTWSRKGRGGISPKGSVHMVYGGSGAELRTLELPATPDECMQMFVVLSQILGLVVRGELGNVSALAREMLAAHDLPWSQWESPQRSPEIWRQYVASYDALREAARHIVRHELDIRV
jgi:hypothetical protein